MLNLLFIFSLPVCLASFLNGTTPRRYWKKLLFCNLLFLFVQPRTQQDCGTLQFLYLLLITLSELFLKLDFISAEKFIWILWAMPCNLYCSVVFFAYTHAYWKLNHVIKTFALQLIHKHPDFNKNLILTLSLINWPKKTSKFFFSAILILTLSSL